MRVAIIPSADLSYNSGSIIYAKKLFMYLRQNGHEAFLLGSRKPVDIPDEYMKYIIINPYLLEHPIIDDRTVNNIEYSRSLSGVIDYILELQEEKRIDIIHAHYGSFSSFGAYVAHGLTEAPYVVSSFRRDINIGYACDRRLKWFIEKSFLDAASIIITEESLKTKLNNIFTSYDITNKIVEIPMPIDRLMMEAGDLNIKENVPVLSTINSCFSPEKGISTILKAFSMVLKKVPCKLFIAGQDDHPNQIHKNSLLEEVRSLGIENHVVFLGYLNRQNVGNLLKSSTLFIDARLKGNFSSVVLEAMFNNVPVIASNTEASKKIIQQGHNGYIFSPGDAQGLKELIMKCILNQQTLTDVKYNISKWVDRHGEQYSEEGCFAKVLDIYKETVKGYGEK